MVATIPTAPAKHRAPHPPTAIAPPPVAPTVPPHRRVGVAAEAAVAIPVAATQAVAVQAADFQAAEVDADKHISHII